MCGEINIVSAGLELLFDCGIWNLHHVESCHTCTGSIFASPSQSGEVCKQFAEQVLHWLTFCFVLKINQASHRHVLIAAMGLEKWHPRFLRGSQAAQCFALIGFDSGMECILIY